MTTIEDYTERSFVVRGDTRPFSLAFKNMGGRWNPNLTDGPAWIFPKTREEEVRNWLIRTVQSPEPSTVRNNPPIIRRTNNSEFNTITEQLQATRLSITQRLQLIHLLSGHDQVRKELTYDEEDDTKEP